ncbi:MAG: Fe(3+) dicitrate ABC transporter substrate-binding protein [Roseobacter sp.]
MELLKLVAVATIAIFVASHAIARDVEHELGKTNVPDAPERIVVLEFSFIDGLASVGVAPVGIADDNKRERVVPEYIEIIGDDWTSVGTRATPSLEIIASLSPDLIIADLSRHAEAYETLSEIAPTIVLNSLGGNYHDAVEQMSVIGEAIGKSDEMQARIAEHQATMATFAKEVASRAEGLTAQFGVTRTDALSLHSPISYNGSLLERLGFEAAMEIPETGGVRETNYVSTSLEQLSEINPDILIFGAYTDPNIEQTWNSEALYQGMTAVQHGHVFQVTAHNWSRLRGILAAELTAADLSEILDQLD